PWRKRRFSRRRQASVTPRGQLGPHRLEGVDMKRFQGSLALGLFACAAGYSQNALAVCQFGTSGEPSLQQSFDTLFGAAHSPNAVNDCLTDGSGPGHDGVWQSTGATSATILLE